MSIRWASALREAGASEGLVQSWRMLRTAVGTHQQLLSDNGIGKEVNERDRVRVNARRVGLEAPPFADEAEASFTNIFKRAFERRADALDKNAAVATAKVADAASTGT